MSASVPKLRGWRGLFRLALVCAIVLQSGCYYLQAARGQAALSMGARDIEKVIADPESDAQLRERLTLVRNALAFAHEELGLPDNGSYRRYVALKNDYVVINVFATPEFSLTPKAWCYPFVGCLSYRGYFSLAAARRAQASLAARGYDVALGKVPAYSTLGRFKDPVLSTMLDDAPHDIVALLFHELAHQRVYLRDETGFNESFATFVADVGLRRWRIKEGVVDGADPREQREERNTQLRALIARYRVELAALYARQISEAQMRELKRERFTKLADEWRESRASSVAPSNNAQLAPVSIYNDLTGVFAALYQDCEASLECFYESTQQLASMDESPREARIEALSNASN